MKNFFTETLKRREKDAGLAPEPKPAPKQESPAGTGSFFYDTPAELRKKAGKPTK